MIKKKINTGQYFSEIEFLNIFLRKEKILKNYVNKNVDSVKKIREVFRSNSLENIYEATLNGSFYTFQLFDDSLIQFSLQIDPLIIRYCYIPFPYKTITYEDFLVLNGFDFDDVDVDDIFMDEYDNYQCNSKLKEDVYIIRYDYSEELYKEKLHSVSHIHFGFTEVRIGTSIKIYPKAFIFFIIKQLYPEKWKDLILTRDFLEIHRKSKSSCVGIDNKFLTKNDKSELLIS